MSITVVALSGSLRTGSFNRQLLSVAVAGARAAGATVEVIDLADHPAPLYDGDLEAREGIPESIRALRARLAPAQGWLLACPEYNGSITPLLKNTLDWCSRPLPEDTPYGATRGRVVGLLSASAGALGGLRGLRHVREIMTNLQALVLPEQFALGHADKAFAQGPEAMPDGDRRKAEAIAARVVAVAGKLA